VFFYNQHFFIKCSYRPHFINKGQITQKIMTCVHILLCCCLIISKALIPVDISNIIIFFTLVLMYIMLFLWVWLCYKDALSSLKDTQNKISTSSLQWIRNTKIGFFLFAFVTACILFLIINNRNVLFDIYQEYYWIWCGAILILGYIKPACIDSIVVFGTTSIYTGRYRIDYSTITDLLVMKEKQTIQGEIVLIKVFVNNELVGFDKLFLHEYISLRQKVNSVNNGLNFSV